MAKVELKQPIVQAIVEDLTDAQSAVIVNYCGLTVAQDTELRKQLREAGVIYKVCKNTMMKRAFEGTDFAQLDEYLEGPNAIAISKEDAKLKKKQYKAKLAERRYPSVAYEIAAALEEKTNREIRVTVPGHTQRGGAPCAYDRVLATRVGAYAAELILNKEYGYMVGIVDGDTKKVPLSEVAGKLKYVDPKCQMIKDAKTIGISFGE